MSTLNILARVRDMADAHNILPIIHTLHSYGHTCAVVCDDGGKAQKVLNEEFPSLLPYSSITATAPEMYAFHPSCDLYFGSMIDEGIGRDPFSYYKKQGAITAVAQETPGWRLDRWTTYPDIVFAMPEGTETIMQRWSDFVGAVYETNMPQFEHASALSKEVDVPAFLRALHAPIATQRVSLNIPAFYAKATIKLLEEVITQSPHTIFLCSIHPKASAEEKEAFEQFCNKYTNNYNCTEVSLIERCTASHITISSIVSTTLITASLCNSIPVGLTHLPARMELRTLGAYDPPDTFPYIAHDIVTNADTATDILTILTHPPQTHPLKTTPSTERIVSILSRHLS